MQFERTFILSYIFMSNDYQNLKETLKNVFKTEHLYTIDRTLLHKLFEACAPNNAGFVHVYVYINDQRHRGSLLNEKLQCYALILTSK